MTGLAGTALAGEAHSQGAEPKAIPTIAPPDPNPKTPSFKLPPKSCDSHAHIFGPASRYPLSEKRPYDTADAPLETFRSAHEEIGVERCVIVNATVHGNDNRVVTDAIARLLVDNPARLFKFS